MEFNLSTPALLFSAISLFMLAHTNRFLALASLIREHIELYETSTIKDEGKLKQIENFRNRLRVIKHTQIWAVFSFMFCVISMFLIFVRHTLPAEIAFALSLLSLFISLLLSLHELFLSIGALNIELKRVKDLQK